MTRKNRRLVALALILTGVALATALLLFALRQNVTYFMSPTDLVSTSARPLAGGRPIRVGGMVVYGTVKREGTITRFTITDNENNVVIEYDGIVPDLFREGQGIIATGTINDDHVFIATQLLAKHDENYMPPEVAKAMKPHYDAIEAKKQEAQKQ